MNIPILGAIVQGVVSFGSWLVEFFVDRSDSKEAAEKALIEALDKKRIKAEMLKRIRDAEGALIRYLKPILNGRSSNGKITAQFADEEKDKESIEKYCNGLKEETQ